MPKTDEGVVEATPQPSDEPGVAPVADVEIGNEKGDIEVAEADGEEKAVNNTVNSESGFAVSAMKTEEVGLKEMTPSSSATEEAKAAPSSSTAAQCSSTSKADLETPLVLEKAATNDKEKHTKKGAKDVPSGSSNPPACPRQEAPLGAPTEVKKSPLIPRYSRFEFLANSMIITDVTTERGTVTVKECSAYEGFYGPDPDRPS